MSETPMLLTVKVLHVKQKESRADTVPTDRWADHLQVFKQVKLPRQQVLLFAGVDTSTIRDYRYNGGSW